MPIPYIYPLIISNGQALNHLQVNLHGIGFKSDQRPLNARLKHTAKYTLQLHTKQFITWITRTPTQCIKDFNQLRTTGMWHGGQSRREAPDLLSRVPWSTQHYTPTCSLVTTCTTDRTADSAHFYYILTHRYSHMGTSMSLWWCIVHTTGPPGQS